MRSIEGVIELGDEVIIADPCYDDDVWCIADLSNVKPGQYNCKVVLTDAGTWGTRVAELIVERVDNTRKINKYIATVGVDSGQMGIYDYEYFQSTRNNEDWYKKVCKITLEKEAGCIDNKAVVTSSGFGDGLYEVKVAVSRKGVITGFKIKFI